MKLVLFHFIRLKLSKDLYVDRIGIVYDDSLFKQNIYFKSINITQFWNTIIKNGFFVLLYYFLVLEAIIYFFICSNYKMIENLSVVMFYILHVRQIIYSL